jgi:hypothetical protein
MATVSSAPRTTAFTTVSTSVGPFNVGFRLFDTDGLDVYLNGTRTTAFTITATFSDGYTDSATITFTAAVLVGTQVIIDGSLNPRRSDDYLAGDAGLTDKLNIELARIWSALSEVKRDSKRAVRGLEPLEATEDIDFEALLAASEQAAENLLGVFRGNWVTAAVYALGDRVFDATSGNGYQCLIAHTAGTFATDLAASRWGLYVQRGATGAGTGDLLAAQNLNDLADKAASRNNLGVTLPNLGVTSSAAELNIMDGVTATTDEINRATNFGLIAQGTLSGSQLIVEIPADFESIELAYWGYLPSTNGQILLLTIGSGPIGTPVWGTNHVEQAISLTATTPSYVNTVSGASVSASLVQNNTQPAGHGNFRLAGFNSVGAVVGQSFRAGVNLTPAREMSTGSMAEETAVSHTLIRLSVAAGTMAGTYRITGYRKP